MPTANPRYNCCTPNNTQYSSFKVEGGNLYLYTPEGKLGKTVNLTEARLHEQGNEVIIYERGSLDPSVIIYGGNTLTDQVSGASGLTLEDLERDAGAPIDPAGGAFSVTPSDVSNLSRETRSIYVGTGGDLRVTTV